MLKVDFYREHDSHFFKSQEYFNESFENSPEAAKGFPGQPTFIDHIIRIMLCRVYVNVQDRKLLTAEKILGNVASLLKCLEDGTKIEIVKHPEIRAENGCDYYDLDTLSKKYWLMRGILYQSLNRPYESRDSFL